MVRLGGGGTRDCRTAGRPVVSRVSATVPSHGGRGRRFAPQQAAVEHVGRVATLGLSRTTPTAPPVCFGSTWAWTARAGPRRLSISTRTGTDSPSSDQRQLSHATSPGAPVERTDRGCQARLLAPETVSGGATPTLALAPPLPLHPQGGPIRSPLSAGPVARHRSIPTMAPTVSPSRPRAARVSRGQPPLAPTVWLFETAPERSVCLRPSSRSRHCLTG